MGTKFCGQYLAVDQWLVEIVTKIVTSPRVSKVSLPAPFKQLLKSVIIAAWLIIRM